MITRTPRSPPRRGIAAVILVALFTAFAVFAHSGARAPGEAATLRDIHRWAPQSLDSAMLWVTRLGGAATVVALAILIGGYLALRRRWQGAVLVVGSVGAAGITTAILKLIVERARPHVFSWLTPENGYSFPSGHSTASMALALSLVALTWHGRHRVVVAFTAIPLAIGVGVSRLFLGVHYPTDVLAGWFVAATTVSAVYALLGRLGSRRGWQQTVPSEGLRSTL